MTHDIEAAASVFKTIGNPPPIVLYGETASIIFYLQTNDDPPGIAVLDGIVSGFLGYPVQVIGDSWIVNERRRNIQKIAFNIRLRADLIGKAIQCKYQSLWLRRYRQQSHSQVTSS